MDHETAGFLRLGECVMWCVRAIGISLGAFGGAPVVRASLRDGVEFLIE